MRNPIERWKVLRSLDARLAADLPDARESFEEDAGGWTASAARAARIVAALRREPGRPREVRRPVLRSPRLGRLAAAASFALAALLLWGRDRAGQDDAARDPARTAPSVTAPAAGLASLRELMELDATPLLAAADRPLADEAANLWSDTSRAALGFVRALPLPPRQRASLGAAAAHDPGATLDR